MTAFRATSSCFICPTPARAFSRLNYFRLPYTFYFRCKDTAFFSHLQISFCFYIFFFATILLFLKRGPRKFVICGESGGISRLNVATRQSCDLLPNAYIRWLLRSACFFPPRLCHLPAVQHNTSGGVARYPARSVFEYTLFFVFFVSIYLRISKKIRTFAVTLSVVYLVHKDHIPLSRRYPEDTPKIDMRRWSKEYWIFTLVLGVIYCLIFAVIQLIKYIANC